MMSLGLQERITKIPAPNDTWVTSKIEVRHQVKTLLQGLLLLMKGYNQLQKEKSGISAHPSGLVAPPRIELGSKV